MSYQKNKILTLETTATVTVLADNGPIDIICSGTTLVILPADPPHGMTVTVKDGRGLAASNPIVISGTHTVDSNVAGFINNNFESKTVRFSTTANQWFIL